MIVKPRSSRIPGVFVLRGDRQAMQHLSPCLPAPARSSRMRNADARTAAWKLYYGSIGCPGETPPLPIRRRFPRTRAPVSHSAAEAFDHPMQFGIARRVVTPLKSWLATVAAYERRVFRRNAIALHVLAAKFCRGRCGRHVLRRDGETRPLLPTAAISENRRRDPASIGAETTCRSTSFRSGHSAPQRQHM